MKNIDIITNVHITLNEVTEMLVEDEIGYLKCRIKENLPEEEVDKLFADAKKKMIDELWAYHRFALLHIYSNTSLESEDDDDSGDDSNDDDSGDVEDSE